MSERSKTTRFSLPAPFAWMPIPAGKVTLSTQKTFEVSAFEIAKYPVTNAQFAEFIKAGGYTTQRWWTTDGWQKRQQEKWAAPRYWTDAQWNGANYPVVGVSWYEAVAFCVWMSEATGDNIMLPTEQQWQRAAQAQPDGGDSGQAYVWGYAWKQGVCNNSVKPEDSHQTTPVTQFESVENVSLCGVVDLIGNVLELCLTEYETGNQDLNGINSRVLRGGSWDDFNTVHFRADSRSRCLPDDWFKDFGFRLARFK